ncbi:MAG: YitT family protein [Lachnospiraceae bacterium]|nr:YitT family protein [Lachnospiraceae bacterium]
MSFIKGKSKEEIKKSAKRLALDTVCDVIGSILYAMGLYTFAKMANFSPGGISGIALILNYLWKLPVGVMTLIMNIPLVIASYKIVGGRFLAKTAKTMIITTLFLDVIFPLLPLYTGNRMMAALYSGLCMGAGMAFFYMRGSSSGGMDFLSMIIKVKHPHISLGIVTAVSDFLVILIGWPVFKDADAVLYGLICSFAASIVIDRVLYGIGAGKLVIVITNNTDALTEKISELTDRGSTIIRAIGSYTKEDRDVILCACSKSQTYMITNAAHEVDPGAFVMVTETSEVFGEGFKEYKK